MVNLRPHQQEVVNFSGGRMGVAAVPGSGKTQTLSYLAARLIADGLLEEDQEVLIVTLVNSAVDNFSKRIKGFVQDAGLLPGLGYRVRTLHGLAHDIVRERPDVVGLSGQFTILDEAESEQITRTIAASWLKQHPGLVQAYAKDEYALSSASRQAWEKLAVELGIAFIRQAKDLQFTPQRLREALAEAQVDDDLLNACLDFYRDYQQALDYRGALDYDDLIRLALRILEIDPDYLRALRRRWPFILEDEAQDSSRLQEEILRLLVGETGGWVRVGDPNQAIYETFTTASPEYLLRFLREPGVVSLTLPNSGRSAKRIIDLANTLVEWARRSGDLHPSLHTALAHTYIEPTPTGDPQPNPPDRENNVILYLGQPLSPEKELDLLVKSAKRFVEEHPDETCAILAATNQRGASIYAELKKMGVPARELLRSSQDTRAAAGILLAVLQALNQPNDPKKVQHAFKAVYFRAEREDSAQESLELAYQTLGKCSQVEDFLVPVPGRDWLAALQTNGLEDAAAAWLDSFRQTFIRWQNAVLLPVDQLILTIAQELFSLPAELAVAHKIALSLERLAQTHPDWGLAQFIQELIEIEASRRKFSGLSEDDTGFDPDAHPGEVVVATMHKAKGLEWDKVYLTSVNNYDFPSGSDEDFYQSERYIIRDRLNLEAEVTARLKALAEHDLAGLHLEEGAATRAARLNVAGERLRLLYVGITRARKELVITSNTGRNGSCRPALIFSGLKNEWERRNGTSS